MYIPTIQSASQMVMEVGVGTFGQEDVAEEAASEFQILIGKNEDPRLVAWEVFIEFLEMRGRLAAAFSAAWPMDGVIPFLVKKGYPVEDAEDINSIVMLSCWRSFSTARYKPWLSKWTTFMLMSATRKAASWNAATRDVRRIEVPTSRIPEDIAGLLHFDSYTILEDKRGWSVPIVCDEWLCSNDSARVEFADIILQIHSNQMGYIAPSGYELAEMLGVSRMKCHRLFVEFSSEVKERESKG